MKWFKHKSLSEKDMELLAGTDLMVRLQTNRLVIIYEPKFKKPSFKEMGLHECEDLFYLRIPKERHDGDTVEIMFASADDLELVQQHMTQFKISQ